MVYLIENNYLKYKQTDIIPYILMVEPIKIYEIKYKNKPPQPQLYSLKLIIYDANNILSTY